MISNKVERGGPSRDRLRPFLEWPVVASCSSNFKREEEEEEEEALDDVSEDGGHRRSLLNSIQ